MGEFDDLSLWHKVDDATYVCNPQWWYSYHLRQAQDGLWYWSYIDHDGWDGEQVIDELMDAAAEGEGFQTWEEAARWVNENKGID